jgi:hypothetical protein
VPAGTFIALCIGAGAAIWHLVLGGHWSGLAIWPALFAAWHWSQVAGRARYGRLDLKRPRLWAATLALWLPLPLLWHCATTSHLPGYDRPNALHGLAALVLAGCAVRSWTLLRAVHASGRWPAMAAARIVAVPLAVGACVALSHSPGGDEPHYLRITRSLAEDGDLDILNQVEAEGGGPVTAGDPRVHGARRVAPDGSIRWISQHLPGLPALLWPSWSAAGRAGAVATTALLGWVCVLLATAWCRQWGCSPVASMAGGLLAGFGTPVASYSSVLFPEVPAAAAALTVAWAMGSTRRRPVLAAFCLAALPWLNFRFVAVGLPLGLYALWRARKSPAELVPLITIPAIWIGALFYYVHWVTGAWDPSALYPGMELWGASASSVERVATGLLLDHRVGLFVIAPVWCVALAAFNRVSSITVIPFLLTAALLGFGQADWDGSWSPAGRLVVASLPLMAPLMADGWSRAAEGRGVSRALLAGLTLFAIAQTIAALSNPTLAWTDSGQDATLLGRAIGALLPNWDTGASTVAALLRTAPLVAALAGVTWLLSLKSRGAVAAPSGGLPGERSAGGP